MESFFTYLAIAIGLFIIFLLNNRRNKSVKKERKSKSFKQSYYERKKAEKELKEK